MAKAGDVIDNPTTGERITFLETTLETNGELLRFVSEIRPLLRFERLFETYFGLARDGKTTK